MLLFHKSFGMNMKILAVDTTAVTVTAAICEDGATLSLFTLNTSKNHGEMLLPMLDVQLKPLGLTLDDIDLFAVSVGPGSFTGVRVGVSTVKGLAFDGKPCVAVSSLEALAENLRGVDELVVPVMDARRSQLYTAIFRDGERLMDDSLITAAELNAKLNEIGGTVRFVGDGYKVARTLIDYPNIAETPEFCRYQNAASVAAVGYRMYLDGRGVMSAAELAPLYLRASQAERERNERLAAESANNQQ